MTSLKALHRSVLFVGALSLLLSGLTPAAEARHSCYPDRCRFGDARIGAISTTGQAFAGRENFARVSGRNIGKASDIVARLSSNNGQTTPHVTARVHAGPDKPFSVYFRWTPARPDRARLRGCATAKPRDEDRSNDCGRTSVDVNEAP